jgi:ankyrin repeat protein
MTYRTVRFVAPVAVGILLVGLAAHTPVAARRQEKSAPDLIAALKGGIVRDVERILSSGGDADTVTVDGTPALMVAALYGGADIVELLLKRGANPNRTDAAGATALMWAAHDPDKVRVLLAHGGDVTVRSKSGRTPLLVAAAYPRTLSSITQLAARGADLRAEDQGRVNALTLAARSSDIEVVRYLVERGLDPAALPAGRRTAGGTRAA